MAEKKSSTGSVLSAEERAAMRALQAERKASQKQADLDKAMADAIAALPAGDKAIVKAVEAIVREHAPHLTGKTFYGMPGWARDGKMCVFVQPSSKFGVRYSTLGFEQPANLDDGDMWATAFAVLKVGPEETKRITALVKQAAS